MLKQNFKYESIQLLRSRWIQLLSLLLLTIFGFAIYNGAIRAEKRQADWTQITTEKNEQYEKLYTILDSVERGFEPEEFYLTDAIIVGFRYPQLAAKPTSSMAFMATGQSDMYSDFQEASVYGSGLMTDYTEMTSPVQLLFGSFDLSFVIVYLLPLLIIAFSYNILSAERESGTLRLLGSQAISIRTWLLQQLFIRFLWLALLVLVSLSVLLLVFNAEALGDLGLLLSLYGLVLAYMLFWFALAFLVNLWVGTSAKNAVSLLGLWIFIVLLVPSMLNQLGTALYPMPSRTLLINDVRTLQADVNKRQDEILDGYLRDHPEFATQDSTVQFGIWHRYMASQKLMREEMAPVLNNFEDQLKKQQAWIDQFKWLSPAVTTQESLNAMAGTATEDYASFRKQVEAFQEDWRNHFTPMLYNNKVFKKEDVAKLPKFEYKSREWSLSALWLNVLIAGIVFAIAYLWSRRRKNQLIVN